MILFLLIFFILGLFVGSFLNVLADRLPRNENPLKGRSYCESCKKELGILDLIPLFSFIFLRGKCRYCKVKLSFYYPLVELVTGIIFVITFLSIYNLQFSFIINSSSLILNLIYSLFLVSCLIVIFFADLKYGIIPDKILVPAVIVVTVWLVVSSQQLLVSHLLSAFGSFLFFLLIFLVTRGRGMGFGDVKFAFLIGLILGFPLTIFSHYIAFLTGAFISVILILTGKKKLKKSTVAFGPFLALATLICIFWGPQVTDFFLHLLQFK